MKLVTCAMITIPPSKYNGHCTGNKYLPIKVNFVNNRVPKYVICIHMIIKKGFMVYISNKLEYISCFFTIFTMGG